MKPISTLLPSIEAETLSLAAPRDVVLEILIELSSKTHLIGLLIFEVIRSEGQKLKVKSLEECGSAANTRF